MTRSYSDPTGDQAARSVDRGWSTPHDRRSGALHQQQEARPRGNSDGLDITRKATSLMNTVTDTPVFPESVYRFVDETPGEGIDGITTPPFTREVAEKIAATKPYWAVFDDTDITGDSLNRDVTQTLVTWCRNIGAHVDIVQDVDYRMVDGEKVEEHPVTIQVWGGDPSRITDPAEARELASETNAATHLLSLIKDGLPLDYNPVAEFVEKENQVTAEFIEMYGATVQAQMPKWADPDQLAEYLCALPGNDDMEIIFDKKFDAHFSITQFGVFDYSTEKLTLEPVKFCIEARDVEYASVEAVVAFLDQCEHALTAFREVVG